MNQQQDKESLTFRVGLSGTYWDKLPAYSVLLDGVEYASGQVGDTVEYVEFSADVTEDSEHLLEVKLTNKENSDTVKDPANGEPFVIVKDMLLNIESVVIDDINLEQLKWDASEFIPDEPSRPTIKKCINLGWNGSYRLKFSSPFYLWLLESM
jgi:hypothetical protein